MLIHSIMKSEFIHTKIQRPEEIPSIVAIWESAVFAVIAVKNTTAQQRENRKKNDPIHSLEAILPFHYQQCK